MSDEVNEVEVNETEGTEITTPHSEAEPVEVAKDLEVEAKAEEPEYQPNFKFKVMDQEKEFDEWLRPVVKDADTEKKVRELLEKAYGLDHQKPKFEERTKQLEETTKNYELLRSAAEEAFTFRDKGDLDRFFEVTSVKPEAVYQWVLDKMKQMELPEEQRQVYNKFDETRRQNYLLERQLQDVARREEALSVQARTTELQNALQSPEISHVARVYDETQGQTGKFEQLVIKCGRDAWRDEKRELTVEQAVQSAISLIGKAYQQPGQANGTQTEAEKPLPTIPRVAGKSVSAIRKSPTSINDLRKMAAAME